MRDMTGKNKDHAAALAGTCSVIELDVCNESTVEQAIATIIDREGRIDAVVNNAGYGLFGPIEETTEQQFKDQFETNFFGVLRVIRHSMPHMRKQGSGVFVQISSVSGRVITPFGGPYQASKWALEAASEALLMEAAHFGIRVVLIEPGNVKTDIAPVWPDTILEGRSAYQGLRDDMIANPLGLTFLEVEEVAETIANAVEDPATPVRVPMGEGIPEMIDRKMKMTAEEFKADTWLRRNLSW